MTRRHILSLLIWAVSVIAAPAAAFELRILSADETLSDDIRAATLLGRLSRDRVDNAQDIVLAAKADYRSILALLYDKGRFGPSISIDIDGREAQAIPAVSPPRHVSVVEIRVDPGKPFRFGRAEVAPLAPGTDLPPGFSSGAPAAVEPMRDAALAAVEGWRETGRAKAALAWQRIVADHRRNVLDVEMRIVPGPALRFGQLQVRGIRRVRPERVRAIAGLPTGKTFSPRELDEAARRLRRSGAFGAVVLEEAESPNADGTLDIIAELADMPRRRIGASAEISSLEGLKLSAFWLHRSLFGGAERLRIEAEAGGLAGNSGGEDYRIAARFTRPATPRAETDFTAEVEAAWFDEPSIQTRSAGIEVGFHRFARGGREYTYALGALNERTIDALGRRDQTLLTLPLSAQIDRRDNQLDAAKGYFARLELTPFAGLGAAPSGMRSRLGLRGYRALGPDKRLVLASRVQLGSTVGPTLTQAPGDYLFFSGGGGTVRGQPFQSLGVDLGGGNVVGGRSFFGLSGEARFKPFERVGVVAFWDTGYVGAESFPNGRDGAWHSGAGLGLRYDTGIGPLRLDVAVPTSGPGTGNNFEIYLGIGQAF